MQITKCRDSMFELLSDSSGRILKFDLETRETQVTEYSGKGYIFSLPLLKIFFLSNAHVLYFSSFFSWIGENKWFLEENQRLFA